MYREAPHTLHPTSPAATSHKPQHTFPTRKPRGVLLACVHLPIELCEPCTQDGAAPTPCPPCAGQPPRVLVSPRLRVLVSPAALTVPLWTCSESRQRSVGRSLSGSDSHPLKSEKRDVSN